MYTSLNIMLEDNIKIIKIDCGDAHTLYLTSNGIVYSGGYDEYNYGILSHGKNKKETQNPEIIKHFMNNNIFIIDIACGESHNLVIDNNGNGYSWGNNYRD